MLDRRYALSDLEIGEHHLRQRRVRGVGHHRAERQARGLVDQHPVAETQVVARHDPYLVRESAGDPFVGEQLEVIVLLEFTPVDGGEG